MRELTFVARRTVERHEPSPPAIWWWCHGTSRAASVTAAAPGSSQHCRAVPELASVYAISNVVGALSLIPGGIGAYEASVLGLLVAIGLDPATAAAAALLHRVADKGCATVLGFITYAVVRHRLRLTSIVATQPARHIRVEGLPGDVAGWHRLGAAAEEQFRTLGGRAASPPEPWDITLACELRH
jgi:Lysylphosphatidylglycerol synthase TM region